MIIFLRISTHSYSFLFLGGEPVTCKGEFTASGVHKQFGISFKTPKYPNQMIKEDVRVQMYLYKPSDKSTSEPVDFWYMADVSKEENRSPRPGNRRGRHDNNQNEPSSGKFVFHSHLDDFIL